MFTAGQKLRWTDTAPHILFPKGRLARLSQKVTLKTMPHPAFSPRLRAVARLCAVATTLSLLPSALSAEQVQTPVPAAPSQVASENAETQNPDKPAGYLKKSELPDSLAILPPPPQPGTPAFALNEEVHRQAAELRGTPRWALAMQDADLREGGAITAFSCALGVRVSPQNTPQLYTLLLRAMRDTARSTNAAKKHYQFTRPFAARGETTCTPEKEPSMHTNGSYPSAHSARGWALSLILSELAPDRVTELMSRARAYGQSRLVCNAHWQSDVLQGRVMADATVARLHAVPDFVRDMAIARTELAAARAAGDLPKHDCAAEAEALKTSIPDAY